MTYGLDRPFREDGAPAPWPRNRYRAWLLLDTQSRLDLVERELKPANASTDFPLAL